MYITWNKLPAKLCIEYGQLAPKVNLYATEVEIKELKVHAEGLLTREVYDLG